VTEILETCKRWLCECGSGVAEVDDRLMRVNLMLSLHNSGSDVEVRWVDFEGPNSSSRLRSIRDKLVSEDRFSMALDLSTKCQLECASVWSDWSRALVAMGQCVPLHVCYVIFCDLDVRPGMKPQKRKSNAVGPRPAGPECKKCREGLGLIHLQLPAALLKTALRPTLL
jgi:hypothetical protein